MTGHGHVLGLLRHEHGVEGMAAVAFHGLNDSGAERNASEAK